MKACLNLRETNRMDALSVMVIIIGNGIGNPSSNPGWDCLLVL